MEAQMLLDCVLQDNKKREVVSLDASGSILFKETHLNKETYKTFNIELSDNNSREIYEIDFALSISNLTADRNLKNISLDDKVKYDSDFQADLNNAMNSNNDNFKTKRIREFYDLTIRDLYKKAIREDIFNRDTLVYLTKIDNLNDREPSLIQKLYWGHGVDKEAKNLYNCINLHNLSIWNTSGHCLTKDVVKLQNLSILSINNMTDISEEFLNRIHTLPYLVSLSIYKSKDGCNHYFQLEKLPLNLEKLQCLKYLDLDKNKLSNFSEISKLSGLKTLSVRHNSFSDLENIENLNELESLDIAENNFSELPTALQSLKKLKILNLSKNPLKEVPEWLCEMSQLEELYLEQTQLTTLPDNIIKLKNLRVLGLKKNPFVGLPQTMLKIPKKVLDLELCNIALFDKKAKVRLEQYPTGNCLFENDINLKLMIIQKLMYEDELLLPKFDIFEFAKQNNIDIEEDGYSIIPESLDFFKALEIPMKLLIDIEELESSGGDNIYHQMIPFWDGEDETFQVKNIADIQYLPRLKRTNSMNFDKELKKQLKERKIKVSTY